MIEVIDTLITKKAISIVIAILLLFVIIILALLLLPFQTLQTPTFISSRPITEFSLAQLDSPELLIKLCLRMGITSPEFTTRGDPVILCCWWGQPHSRKSCWTGLPEMLWSKLWSRVADLVEQFSNCLEYPHPRSGFEYGCIPASCYYVPWEGE